MSGRGRRRGRGLERQSRHRREVDVLDILNALHAAYELCGNSGRWSTISGMCVQRALCAGAQSRGWTEERSPLGEEGAQQPRWGLSETRAQYATAGALRYSRGRKDPDGAQSCRRHPPDGERGTRVVGVCADGRKRADGGGASVALYKTYPEYV